jgi:hypothetical protein
MKRNVLRGRLEQLRRALETACAEATAANIAAVADALQAVEFSTDEDDDDDVMARRNDAIEMYRIPPLSRRLLAQLGPSAPAWLRRYVLGDDEAPTNAIAYECTICGAKVQSAPGMSANCSDGHPPAPLVAREQHESTRAAPDKSSVSDQGNGEI